MTPTWSPCPRLPVLSVQGTVRYGPPAQLWCLEAQCSHNCSRGLGSLPPLNQAPLPPKEVPGGSVNRGETGARTPKAICSGRILGPEVGREGGPSTSLPHSHPTSREALHPLLSLEGPMGLSVWPNCVSASRHLPSHRSPGSESRGLPYLWTSMAGRSLRCKPHCGSLLRVTSHLRKPTPHTAAPRCPFPLALHGGLTLPVSLGSPLSGPPGFLPHWDG